MDRVFRKTHYPEGLKSNLSEEEESIDLPLNDILSTTHIRDSNGFFLRCKDESPYFPSNLEITPTLGIGQVSVSMPRWRMETPTMSSAKSLKQSWTKQTISISLVSQSRSRHFPDTVEDVSLFSHRHATSLVNVIAGSASKGKVVDVYLPQRSESLGWIKYYSDYHNPLKENGWVMHDYLSKTDFISSPLEFMEDLKFSSGDEVMLGMQISNEEGHPVAVFQAKRGMKQRRTGQVNWTDWKVHFTPGFSSNLPSSAKAVILVACVMWVLNYQERSAKSRAFLSHSRRQSSLE